MSLSTGRGPLSGRPAGRFTAKLPADVAYIEPFPRRVRGVKEGRALIDSERVLLVHRPGRPPEYAFPEEDVHGPAGAPEPDGNGGFVRDAQRQVVLTHLDTGLMRDVAAAGGGSYVPFTSLPALIRTLDDARSREMTSGVAAPHVKVESWLNDGVWLLPPLLLLAALIARRGWL